MALKQKRLIKEMGEYHEDIERIEEKRDRTIEIGNGLKADLEQLDMVSGAVGEMELPESVKKCLLRDIQTEIRKFEKIYRDNVEKPMEESEKELESIEANIEEIINEAVEAKSKLEAASKIQSSELVSLGDLGKAEAEKTEIDFKNLINEAKQKQTAQREQFSRQRAETLRRNLNS